MINFNDLKKPFKQEDIEWRIQTSGISNKVPWARVLAYVTNRGIMDRLDSVCGAENWRNEYLQAPGGGILCGISIKNEGEWITKYDGAENTQIEAVKGGLSAAMKRAAVQWGIGRYLYKLDAGFAQNISSKKYNGSIYCPINTKKNIPAFYWTPPELPGWALPENKDKSCLTK